jgi:hypothetical protein
VSLFSGCPRKHGCLYWSFSLTGTELHLRACTRELGRSTGSRAQTEETYGSIPSSGKLDLRWSERQDDKDITAGGRFYLSSGLHVSDPQCHGERPGSVSIAEEVVWFVVSDARTLPAGVGGWRSVRVSGVIPWTRRRLSRVHRS